MGHKINKIYDTPSDQWSRTDKASHFFNELRFHKAYQITVILITAAAAIAFYLDIPPLVITLVGLLLPMALITFMPWGWRGVIKFFFLGGIIFSGALMVYVGLSLLFQ